MLTISIDWLAVTFKEFERETETFIRTYASAPTVQDMSARNGYTVATMDGNGVQLLWNPDYSSMGHHAVFGGSSLRNLFTSGVVSPHSLLRACIDAGGSISRLDLAKDLTEQPIDYEKVYQSLKQGHNGGTARNISRLESADGGTTIYVGSRQSERFVRLYDKAIEQKLPNAIWARLEVETKGMVARAVATALLSNSRWSDAFDAAVVAMVGDVQKAGLAEFFPGGRVPIGLPKIERQTDREMWIETQVISAVSRHFIDNPNSEAVARLRQTLDLIDRQRKL
jgi:hypothetical protein